MLRQRTEYRKSTAEELRHVFHGGGSSAVGAAEQHQQNLMSLLREAASTVSGSDGSGSAGQVPVCVNIRRNL